MGSDMLSPTFSWPHRCRYFGLDPIKWVMMYIMNEDGFRDLAAHKVPTLCCLHLQIASMLQVFEKHRTHAAACMLRCNQPSSVCTHASWHPQPAVHLL